MSSTAPWTARRGTFLAKPSPTMPSSSISVSQRRTGFPSSASGAKLAEPCRSSSSRRGTVGATRSTASMPALTTTWQNRFTWRRSSHGLRALLRRAVGQCVERVRLWSRPVGHPRQPGLCRRQRDQAHVARISTAGVSDAPFRTSGVAQRNRRPSLTIRTLIATPIRSRCSSAGSGESSASTSSRPCAASATSSAPKVASPAMHRSPRSRRRET